jgi:tRNA 5-methylaminomethyl-2-thiouridine biosynthesis bifunctional protein
LLGQAPVVVVTAALGSLHLLTGSPGLLNRDVVPLHPVQGQMSLAALDGEPLAVRPLRDNGVFVPEYRDSGLPPEWPARIWAMGSTYERGQTHTTLSDAAHQRNANSLQAICPPAAERLQSALASGDLLGWAGVRCASLDRLPLMGAVPHLTALMAQMATAGMRRNRLTLADIPRWPGLYTLCAMGSRGLTLAHWCATQLAVQIEGSPEGVATVEPDLLRALDPARFAWKQARRQPANLQSGLS